MALLKWNSSYSVKVTELDRQHSQLIGMINDIHDAMKAGKSNDELGKILNQLILYTQQHFTLEERFMKKAAYKDLEKHKKEHSEFTTIIKDFKKEFENGKATISIKTMNFLMEWVRKHIMDVDRKYSEQLNSSGIK